MSLYGTAQEVKTDGRILTVSVSGAQSGWPVFLLHGTPGSRVGPKPRGSVLYRRGIRLICYDRPGYGGSTPKPGRRVMDAAQDVAAIATELDIKEFSVVGRSGGGPHALACAAMLSDRVFRAAALVSLAPNLPDIDWFGGMTTTNVDDYTVADSSRAALVDRITSKACRVRHDPLSLVDRMEPHMARADRTVLVDYALRGQLAAAYDEGLREGPDGWIDDILAFRQEWGFDVAGIEVPVLLWHGVEDNFAPVTHTKWLARRIRGSVVQLQARTAHFGAMEILPDVLTWLSPHGSTDHPDHALLSERLRVDHSVQ